MLAWRTRKRGSPRQRGLKFPVKKGSRGTLFAPARYKYLEDIVSFRSPAEARISVELLWNEFNGASTRAKKLRIARATMYAANRADAAAKKKNLSPKERREYKEIARIYRQAAEKMFKRYRREEA